MFITAKTNREVTEHAGRLVRLARRVNPDILGGTPLADLERIAAGPSPARGDRGVYLIMTRSQRGQLGEGAILQRLKKTTLALLSRARNRHRLSMTAGSPSIGAAISTLPRRSLPMITC